jgi:hypothetical protein
VPEASICATHGTCMMSNARRSRGAVRRPEGCLSAPHAPRRTHHAARTACRMVNDARLVGEVESAEDFYPHTCSTRHATRAARSTRHAQHDTRIQSAQRAASGSNQHLRATTRGAARRGAEVVPRRSAPHATTQGYVKTLRRRSAPRAMTRGTARDDPSAQRATRPGNGHRAQRARCRSRVATAQCRGAVAVSRRSARRGPAPRGAAGSWWPPGRGRRPRARQCGTAAARRSRRDRAPRRS